MSFRWSSPPARRPLVAGAVCAVVLPLAALPALGAGSTPLPVPGATAVSTVVRDRLGDADVRRLAAASREKQATVTFAAVTTAQQASAVAARIRARGGQVRMANDVAGYVSGRISPSALPDIVALPQVVAVDLDELLPLPDPRPEPTPAPVRASSAKTAAAGPDASTPDDNPYLPTRDTGAVAFKVAHPTWDGRGTTIGILDSGIDLDHPALQTTSTGERKVVDVFNATSTFDDDPEWLAMSTAVSGPQFTFAARTWTAPSGSYRVATLAERGFVGTELGGDLNRDGDSTDSWGVLYDPATHDVRVDTDGDLDFTDDTAMQPYGADFQVGHFGADDPATAVAERVPFTVDWKEGATPYVAIIVGADAHGTHVAGIAAGHGLFGGAMDGVAPGAQVVAARACIAGGCTAAALLDGVTELVTNRGVDVVNISIGGLPSLNDGNNARAELYNRLIAQQGVQLVISAGNSGPGLNTVGDPAVATDALAVAASVTKETWLSNYGSVVTADSSLFPFSSRGPREDGALKPEIAAPGSAISSVPTWQQGGPVAEAGYPLPPGYAMFNGTSMAAPQTTGAAALLLSAAAAGGQGVTPAQLRQALRASAKPIAGIATYAQGAGLVDVPGAWAVLATGVVPQTYTVSAPVCTALSGQLLTPNSGPGVYNDCLRSQGGQRPGAAKRYSVVITRTSGPDVAQRHALTWIGNDGTFATRQNVVLPLNTPVKVVVTASTATRGISSALLGVDLASTPGVDLLVPVTVVTSAALSLPDYTVTKTGSVQRNATRSVFVEVKPGTRVLDVSLGGIADGSQTRFIANTPYGVPVESTSSLSCYTNFTSSVACDPTHRSYLNPLPGVWELEVESRRTSPVLDNPFSLTLRQLGATVSPDPDVIASATSGVPISRQYTVTNTGGAATLSLGGATMESVRRQAPTIGDLAQQQYPVSVPAGSTRLRGQIGSPSDPRADLDLLLFNCTTGSCVLAAQSAGGSSEESVAVANPAAGTWVFLVDAYAVPSGTTTFSYVDGVTNATFGSVTTAGAPTALATGESTTVPATVTARTPAAAGRAIEATLPVTAPGGVVVGTGLVRVQSVTP